MKRLFLVLVSIMYCSVHTYAQTSDNIVATAQPSISSNSQAAPALKKEYNDNTNSTSYGARGGVWIPDSHLSVLGAHPFLGGHIGRRINRVTIDAVFDFRFVDARKEHKVNVPKEDSVYNSYNFTSQYVGVNFSYILFKKGNKEFNLTAALGYDVINILDLNVQPNRGKGSLDNITKSVSSPNLNAGASYKFYLRQVTDRSKHRYSYLEAMAKYNYVHYRNYGGTDLSGNSIVMGVIYGGYSFKPKPAVAPVN